MLNGTDEEKLQGLRPASTKTRIETLIDFTEIIII